MKKLLIVDMDEVLASYTLKVILTLKAENGIEIDLNSVKGKFLSQSLDPELTEIVSSYPYRKGFFRNLDVIPGSQQALKSLSEFYEIVIASACMQHPNSLNDKLAWLHEHFSFIPYQNIIFCGNKKSIYGDYLVDDHPKHLESFKGSPLLFEAFHNINESRFSRFKTWTELEAFLMTTAN